MSRIQIQARHRYRSGFLLDVDLNAAAALSLVGPSGCGKSTVLAVVAGLLRPDSSRIVLADAVYADSAAGTWLPPDQRDVGLVAQDSLLFPHRTVRENLHYGAVRRPTRPVDPALIIAELELEPLLDRYPATLSGGQARRVAIGRALLRGPRLLLLDEPWVGLDDALRARVIGLVRRCIADYDMAVVMAGHDIDDADALIGHRVLIQNGQVAEPPL